MVEYYYSAKLGRFIDKVTQEDHSKWCSFNGNLREWHEIMVECIIDVANSIQLRDKVEQQDLRLETTTAVDSIFRDSVLYGLASYCGLTLQTTVIDETCGDRIDFVNIKTGEIHGTLHVLDMAL